MTTTERVRRLGQRTWLGTLHAYLDAARRDLSYEGRRLLYRDLHKLPAKYESEDAARRRHRAGDRRRDSQLAQPRTVGPARP